MKAATLLLTGASGFIGSRLARALWGRGHRLLLLCRPASQRRLLDKLARLGVDPGERVEVVAGDIEASDLAVADTDKERLVAEVEEIFHLAAVYRLDVTWEEARRCNVTGTQHLLELAGRCRRLRRFHHVSTLAVAGDFQGHFCEQDLDVGQSFDHAYGRSKFQAECLVRQARRRFPVTVYRPGIVIGDSRSGSAEKIDGPYYLLVLLQRLRSLPGWRRLPLLVPREEGILLHLVPVDYVVEAMVALAEQEGTQGGTFHLMDPRPPSFAQFYQAVLDLLGFRGPRLERPLLRTLRLLRHRATWPLVERATRRLGMPAELLVHLLYRVSYDTSQTATQLGPRGLYCPPCDIYLPPLVRFFEQNLSLRRGAVTV